jgi:hypothetical protein
MISLEASPTPALPPAGSDPLPAAVAPPVRSFEHLLLDLGARIDGGERLVEDASAGRYAGLDAGELIALQAGIYRYSEAVDLGAKLVDRAASSVRAVLQAG